MSDGHFHRKKKRRKLWLVRQKNFRSGRSFPSVALTSGQRFTGPRSRPPTKSAENLSRISTENGKVAIIKRNHPIGPVRVPKSPRLTKLTDILVTSCPSTSTSIKSQMNWNYFFKSGSHLHSLNLKFWTKWLKSVDLTLSSFSWSTTRPFSWFAWVDLKFHWDLSSSESGKTSPSVWRLRFIHSFGQTWKLLLKSWKWESPLIGGDLWYTPN